VPGLNDSSNDLNLLTTWASVPASQGPAMPDGQPMHAVIVTRTASFGREQWACLLLPDEDLAPLQVLIAAAVLHLEARWQNEARNDLPHFQEQRPTPEEHHHREPVVEGCAKQGHIIQRSSHLLAEHHCLQNHTMSSLAFAYSFCGTTQHIVAQQDNITLPAHFFLQDLHTPKATAAKSAARRGKYNATAHVQPQTYLLVYQQIVWCIHKHGRMQQWLTKSV